MTLLESHLEQISLSSAAIGDLEFPLPRIFTNAILHSHDITALIRDTESHERALFTLAVEQEEAQPVAAKIARRSTIHGGNAAGTSNNTQKQGQRATLATLLGGSIGDLVRRQAPKQSEQVEVNVDGLLNGAEKLCRIYPIAGAPGKIAALRSRYERLSSSIAHYENREANQTSQLARLKKISDDDRDIEEPNAEETNDFDSTLHTDPPRDIEQDIKNEEEEIRALEEKKRALEERVSGMEKDLGGLLR